MVVKDFLTGADGDLLIRSGDLVVDESDSMHIQDILMSTPGTWHQFPFMGVGIKSQIGADHTAASLAVLEKNVKLQLAADGYRVSDVKVEMNGNEVQGIAINAER